MPAPSLVTDPVPLIEPMALESSLRLKISVPLLSRSPARIPEALPRPIWSVPPLARLIVPKSPRESVPPIRAVPEPEIVSVPVPSTDPTETSPLEVQVPPLTVTEPVLEAEVPMRALAVLAVPPLMASEPRPPL